MRTVRLGDVLQSESGGTPPRGRADYFKGTVRWAKIQDLTRAGRLLHDTEERISVQAVNDCRLPVFAPGTVLLAMYGSIGVVSIAAVATSANQAILGIRPTGEVDGNYLWLYLKLIAPSLIALGRGGTQSNINASMVRDLRIPLPDVTQQRTLAEQLLAEMKAAELGRIACLHQRELATRLSEEALRAAFVGSWPVQRLGDVVEIQLGKMLSPAAKLGTRPVRYLRNANVQWDRLELDDVAEMDFTEREEAKFSLRLNDILVCEGGEPGRAAIWRNELERCCYQKALHRLRPIREQVDPQFLVFRLRLGGLRGEFSGDHAQTTIAHLPAVRLAEVALPLPSVAEQRRIAAELRERLTTIDQMTRAIDAQLEAIDALPAAILQRAFGEIEAA